MASTMKYEISKEIYNRAVRNRRLAEKEKENKIEKAIIEIKKEEEKNRNK